MKLNYSHYLIQNGKPFLWHKTSYQLLNCKNYGKACLNDVPTLNEIQAAIALFANRKCFGLDNLPAKIFKYERKEPAPAIHNHI